MPTTLIFNNFPLARRLASLSAFVLMFFASTTEALANHSVARKWNEALLQSIREDFARPTVHGRNLFYLSVAMYDAWAVYDTVAQTYFLGKTVHDYTCPFTGIELPLDIGAAREKTISYAAYRLLSHRFKNSPGAAAAQIRFDLLMANLGYDVNNTSLDYSSGDPAALGNYIAFFLINYGLQDQSNEANSYVNKFYQSLNPPLIPALPGNDTILDPNRWQPLALDTFIDQSGHVIPGATPPFLSPEWGAVYGFALHDSDLTMHQRNGNDYWVYHDPGNPPYIDTALGGDPSEFYKWTFSLVAIWSGHLHSDDTVMWDISPASRGNNLSYPSHYSDHDNFYKYIEGGDISTGRAVNPSTGLPYDPQLVKRGDYTRVLAEFWADGPASETPPGHWFTILNYVNDHPQLVKKFKGEGPVLSDLEWDVKAYFTLAGAVHDAAICAWGVKGWYDYIRPVSAIRYMAGKGQSSDNTKMSYHRCGIPLVPGHIELVMAGDPLAGAVNEHVGKIKLWAWKGPGYISDPATDTAGVGWILAENWWPYQRPTFITPPFAGYVSGHSTFSRSAAEVLTMFTGDEYFPGGMGEFPAPKNQFLVFEEGPSEDVTLQWATYRDASDQCSLSRIWGGIHPPADDVPGRLMGIEIGTAAFRLAEAYFKPPYTGIGENAQARISKAYPNPVTGAFVNFELDSPGRKVQVSCLDMNGRELIRKEVVLMEPGQKIGFETSELTPGIYVFRFSGEGWSHSERIVKL